MDAVTLGLGLANSAFGGGLGSSLGKSAPAGPSNAVAGAYGSGLDGSGWSVNFAGVQSTDTNQDKSGGVPGVGVSGVGGVPWWAWAVLAGVVVWRLKRFKR